MREQRPYGSVRGAVSNARPYRDPFPLVIAQEAGQGVDFTGIEHRIPHNSGVSIVAMN
jgi:hypothetical protein